MENVPVDAVEAWSVEQLLAAVMTSGRSLERQAALRARDVASDLLADLGGLGGLARATAEELAARLEAAPEGASRAARVSRASPPCARALVAAFELGRRVAAETEPPASIASSADVAKWGIPRLGALDHEELWLLALDGRSRLRGTRCVARGGLHGMGARPADALRLALRAAASGFVLVHNHPSGDPTPSREDIAITHRIAAAAAVVGMPLLDHVVVTRNGFASVPFSASEAA